MVVNLSHNIRFATATTECMQCNRCCVRPSNEYEISIGKANLRLTIVIASAAAEYFAITWRVKEREREQR